MMLAVLRATAVTTPLIDVVSRLVAVADDDDDRQCCCSW